MRLTSFTNFALRILMYTALNNEKPASVQDIAKAYGISANHVKKAAGELIASGFLRSVQGRYGGLLLAKTPQEINIGAVVRVTEGHMDLVECFDPETNTCPLISVCRISSLFKKALAAFLAVLDDVTLADMLTRPKELKPLLGLESTN